MDAFTDNGWFLDISLDSYKVWMHLQTLLYSSFKLNIMGVCLMWILFLNPLVCPLNTDLSPNMYRQSNAIVLNSTFCTAGLVSQEIGNFQTITAVSPHSS